MNSQSHSSTAPLRDTPDALYISTAETKGAPHANEAKKGSTSRSLRRTKVSQPLTGTSARTPPSLKLGPRHRPDHQVLVRHDTPGLAGPSRYKPALTQTLASSLSLRVVARDDGGHEHRLSQLRPHWKTHRCEPIICGAGSRSRGPQLDPARPPRRHRARRGIERLLCASSTPTSSSRPPKAWI